MDNELANSKIHRKLVTVQLKILGLNAYAVILIIDSTNIKNTINKNNMGILNLNLFHTSIDVSNLHGI